MDQKSLSPESADTPTRNGAISVSELISDNKPRTGWLEKRGAIRKNWKRRFFCLSNNELKYYKKALDKYPNQSPQGEIPLEGCSCEFVSEDKYGKKFCFELHTIANKRVYVLVADNGTSMQEWLTEIRKAMLRIRRQKSRREVSTHRVSVLLQEQEEQARQRMSNSVTERELKSPIPAPASVTSPRSGGAVRSPRGHHRSNSATAEPAEASSVDEKYDMYVKWLQETKSHQRRGTVADRPQAYSMHERLLDDGRPTSPFYASCCKPYGSCTIL